MRSSPFCGHAKPQPAPIMVVKENCWQALGCGRQPGGANSHELGVCPACLEEKLDKINNGSNGGRACWALAGTMCHGRVHGSMAQKIGNCQLCDFFQRVIKEEGHNWVSTIAILTILRAPPADVPTHPERNTTTEERSP